MDTLLLVITVGSLVFALAMCVLVWRMSQDERRRGAARVAQLAAEASGRPAPAAMASPAAAAERKAPWASPPAAAAARVEATPSSGSPTPSSSSRVEATPSSGSPRARAATSKPAPPTEELTLSTGFLGTTNHAPESAGRQRGLAAAAAVLAVALAGFGLYTVAGPEARSAAAARAAAAAAPLELLSLRHERAGGRLSVSGLVKNPSTATAIERVYAVVFVFDQAGTFVTSGRAPVDFIRLGAGDESPFVVALDAPQNVARYRVSFRSDSGTMPHVDKRGAAPVATPIDASATVR